MSKIVVIDGLARSGTTLLSSLIHSQENSSCYRGVFHEFLACDIGIWKKDYALHHLLENDDLVKFKKNTNLFHKIIHKIDKQQFFMSYDSLTDKCFETINRREHTGTINISEWENLLMKSEVNSFTDLDKLYQDIAKKDNADVLGFRWNQGLSYINKFLRNENHFWVSIIRNPMDRAISDKKTFLESYENSIKYTSNYGKLLEKTKNLNNHIIVYYEDLLNNPNEIVKNIYALLNIQLKEVNLDLYHPSGKKYRIETSDLKDKGTDHTVGEDFKGFDLTKINKYKNYLNISDIKKFQNVIKRSKFRFVSSFWKKI